MTSIMTPEEAKNLVEKFGIKVPHHPGEHVRLDFMPENNMEFDDLLDVINVERDILYNFLAGRHPINEEIALGLASIFDSTSVEMWFNLQLMHDAIKYRAQ